LFKTTHITGKIKQISTDFATSASTIDKEHNRNEPTDFKPGSRRRTGSKITSTVDGCSTWRRRDSMVSLVRQERPSLKISTTIVFFKDLLELASVTCKVQCRCSLRNLSGKWVAQFIRSIRSIVTIRKRCREGFNFFSGSIRKLSIDLKKKRCGKRP
jgi:hypothetical protein